MPCITCLSTNSTFHFFDTRHRNDQSGACAYLRMLLTHGARAVLRAAELARRNGRPLDGLRTWATEIQTRAHHNKAACALANKLDRVCYAVLRDHAPYGNPQPRQEKKLTRTAFVIAT